MIELQNVWKSYDSLVAVKDFSLKIEKSQTVGLIGPNGSGKTTLMRMIATLAKPDHGSINVCGVDALTDPRTVRRKIAFMPSEYGFPMDMTIREYIEYFACVFDIDRNRRSEVINDVLMLTDLKDREGVIVRGLSTGNRQRLLLAKTLLPEAELLILDEPAAGLDPGARAEVRGILDELSRMGRSILISSHILADLDEICDEVCIIEQGKLVLHNEINVLRRQFGGDGLRIKLKLHSGDLAAARTILEGFDAVTSVEAVGEHLDFIGTDENCNAILQKLIAADIEILELSRRRPDLESIYIHAVQGLVT